MQRHHRVPIGEPRETGDGVRHAILLLRRDAETGSQLRSRFANILNVPQGTPAVLASPTALLDSLFEHPAHRYHIDLRALL